MLLKAITATNLAVVSGSVREAATRYLGWNVYQHK
jgi:hypothetical protein